MNPAAMTYCTECHSWVGPTGVHDPDCPEREDGDRA
jgi:hypothetical protein